MSRNAENRGPKLYNGVGISSTGWDNAEEESPNNHEFALFSLFDENTIFRLAR